MRKALSLLLSVLILLSFCNNIFAADSKEFAGKTVILHSNDVHGAIEGYTHIAALKSLYKARGAEVILIDAGDFSQGNVKVGDSKGADAITMMNAAGYDIAILGNHEFDYGTARLKDNLSKASFKLICANVFENGNPLCDANCVFTTKSGLKLGFFGLLTSETLTKSISAVRDGVSFFEGEEMFRCAREQVNALAGNDLVICIGHLGIDEESTGNRSIDLLNNVGGIDLFIDAHSHSTIDDIKTVTNEDCTVNGTKITSTGELFNNIGVIVIDDATKKIESVSAIPTEGLNKDAAVSAAEQAVLDRIDEKYGQVFAKSEVELGIEDYKADNRNKETNLGDLIADAMRRRLLREKDIFSLDGDRTVSIINGGTLRTAIHAGDVAMKDIRSVLPFENTLAVVYASGERLLEALESATFATPAGLGGFPQVSGIDFTIDTTKAYDANPEPYPDSTYYGPASIRRVTINSVNGKPFDPKEKYAVVVTDFCAGGGDSYYVFKSAPEQFNTGISLEESVGEYIKTELHGVIGQEYAKPQGRITIKSNPFSDVADDAWYAPYVLDLYGDGVINGTSEATFAPDSELTWAQALKLLLTAKGELNGAVGEGWERKTVSKAAEKGLVDTGINASAAISRIDFCRIAAKINDIKQSSAASAFSDCSDGYVTALVEASVIEGTGDGTFAPDSGMTRAQAAKSVYCIDALSA